MNIIQVIPRFNPKLGGGVNVVYNISKNLSKLGHEVVVLTTDHKFDKDYAETLEIYDVKVIPFKSFVDLCLFIPSPSMYSWLSKNIQRYDIIHLNGARSYQNNIIYKQSKKYDIPYILQAHGSAPRIVERKRLKQMYDLVWGYKVFRNAAKAIALTTTEKFAYCKFGIEEQNVKLIPNGIDLSEFDNLPARGFFREKYKISNDDKVILYLGRLHKSKGLDLLLKAFFYIKKEINNVKLVIAGPNDGYQSKLIKLANMLKIREDIIFTGFISDYYKKMAFIDSDVFVTPRFYGFPITFAESCACGLPIITTDSGDFADWINNRVGYVTSYDEIQLSNAVISVLSNDEIKKIFSNHCRELVKTEFNWEPITKKVEQIYNEVLNERGAKT